MQITHWMSSLAPAQKWVPRTRAQPSSYRALGGGHRHLVIEFPAVRGVPTLCSGGWLHMGVRTPTRRAHGCAWAHTSAHWMAAPAACGQNYA